MAHSGGRGKYKGKETQQKGGGLQRTSSTALWELENDKFQADFNLTSVDQRQFIDASIVADDLW